MTRFVRTDGVVTAGVLTLLGLVHLLWAAGLRAGSVAVLPEREGRPVFLPGRARWAVAPG